MSAHPSLFELTNKQPPQVIVIMPLRDDWTSAAELVRRIDATIPAGTASLQILLVDDGSRQKCEPASFQQSYSIVKEITVLRLRRNLGHQRAIAVGIAYTQNALSCQSVVVMDADGEDTPEGLVQLLNAFSETGGTEAIFAERSRRSEAFTFRFFYRIYKLLHLALTGMTVRVGNFSIFPASYLNTLVVLSELWNHYAAAIFRSNLPYSMIPIPRGTRIAGVSRMNFVALVTHGLSAISVFADVVGVRLLILSLLGSLVASLGIIAVGGIRFLTEKAIPGWATYAAGTLAIIIFQMLTMATTFTFFMLSNRASLGFVPIRDFAFFTESASDIFPQPSHGEPQ